MSDWIPYISTSCVRFCPTQLASAHNDFLVFGSALSFDVCSCPSFSQVSPRNGKDKLIITVLYKLPAKKMSLVNEIDLDGIMVEMGEFGKYQILNYVFLCVAVMLTSSSYLSYIFTAGQVDYRFERHILRWLFLLYPFKI